MLSCLRVLLAVAAVLLVSGDEQFGDSLSLLQAEAQVKTKRASLAAAAATVGAASPPDAAGTNTSVAGELCGAPAPAEGAQLAEGPEDAADERSASEAFASDEKFAASHDLAEDEDEDVDVDEDGEGSAEEVRRSTLWYLLEVLVTLAVLQAFKCRTEAKRAARSEEAEAPVQVDENHAEVAKEAMAKFINAALAGDAVSGESLLRGPLRVHDADIWGCTALHAAAKGGSLRLVQGLLERGAGLHVMDAWDEMPLHLAARAGNTDICDELLAHGALVDAVNAQDWTPLQVAAEEGHEAVCKLLLARGASEPDVPVTEWPHVLKRLLRKEEPVEQGLRESDYWTNEFVPME